MAQGKKRGFVEKMFFGKEKSEGFARATLPSNRWELFWDVFKGSFWKLVLINVLMLLFFIPLFLLLMFRSSGTANFGVIWPFSQSFGVGYQAPPSIAGFAEQINLSINMYTYLLLPIVVMIASLGIAGGAYVIRNLVWTEGIFVANDFWRGIKKNATNMLIIGVTFSLVFYISVVGGSMCDLFATQNQSLKWLFTISKILLYGVLVLYGVMCMHMITMSVTYDLKFRHLLKNSLLFTVGLLPHTIFFLFLGALPFAIFLLGGFFAMIGIVAIFFLGLSFLLLVWTTFCQWAYDKNVNDKVDGAKKNRGIYEKIKESDSGALKKYKEQLASVGKCSLNSKPIKPITDEELRVADLPQSFSRSDIIKLNESKQAIYDDHARYVEEHKNDPEFQIQEETKVWKKERDDREKRIEAAKKELAKRNRNK
jgi:uncharacterized membrane protein YesL